MQRGFIQIPILIAILVGIAAIGGTGFVAYEVGKSSQNQNVSEPASATTTADSQATTTAEIATTTTPTIPAKKQETVAAKPSCIVAVSPKTISQGETATLSWQTTGLPGGVAISTQEVESRRLAGGLGGTLQSTGSRTVSPAVSMHYSVNAYELSVACLATLKVIPASSQPVAIPQNTTAVSTELQIEKCKARREQVRATLETTIQYMVDELAAKYRDELIAGITSELGGAVHPGDLGSFLDSQLSKYRVEKYKYIKAEYDKVANEDYSKCISQI